MLAGGPPLRYLEAVRADHPLSLHGVGMSLGSCGAAAPGPPGPAEDARRSLRALRGLGASVLEPDRRSLPRRSASGADDPRSPGRDGRQRGPGPGSPPAAHPHREPLDLPAVRRGGGSPSRSSCPSSPGAPAAASSSTVNNLFVCASNHAFDPCAWLDAFALEAVEEIHLAGHAVDDADGHPIRIDDHGSAVIEEVWALYREGGRPPGAGSDPHRARREPSAVRGAAGRGASCRPGRPRGVRPPGCRRQRRRRRRRLHRAGLRCRAPPSASGPGPPGRRPPRADSRPCRRPSRRR